MIGTIVNTAAVIGGSFAGILLRKGIPDRFSETMKKTLGVATLILGFSGVLQGLLKADKNGVLSTQNAIFLILCLVIGAAAGEALNIDKGFERLGNFLQRRFAKNEDKFATGFIMASLIYCVGAMAIVGSLQDGLAGDPTILFEKSILDGVMSVLLASAYGSGVLFSAVTVFSYQGIITLCAALLKPLVPALVLAQMSMVGSALIICIALNLLDAVKIRTANLLPATFIPIFWGLITKFYIK